MKIRTECPKKNNKYYNNKRHGGLSAAVDGYPMISGLTVLDNCVGWANSRFNESINDPDLKGVVKSFKYQLVCDAEDFIESAKKQGLKINATPIEGGIMVWQKGSTLSPNDGAGHVAFVERVYEDGTILTSESGWNSWTFKTVRRDNSNGRWGQNAYYRFRGCIINPAIKNPKVVPVPPLNIDGAGGTCTVRAMQRFFGTVQDGVISGQNKTQSKYYPALLAVEYGTGGSACVRKLQKWTGVAQDGIIGEKTIKAWQKKIGVTVDGIFGTNSMKAWQKYLNSHDKATYDGPDPDTDTDKKPTYKVIDVSDWQGSIDWGKVKADGVVGAIIRYADGDVLDKRFKENMEKAKAAGIHIGSYIFSRAKTKAEAESEAARLYNACKPYDPDMPLYIDLEAKGLEKYADEVAIAFLKKMKALGGRPGVYANYNWWTNYLKKTASEYSNNAFWIAQYNKTMDYKPASRMGMWQYTSSGSVKGISGHVDLDHCYIEYWKEETPKAPTPGDKIAEKGWEYAYHNNTSDASYKSGKPKAAYKKALDAAWGKIRKWQAAAAAGASCDVFIATCIRMSGIDENAPRGLGREKYFDKSEKFERVNATAKTAQDGDIISINWTGNKWHWCMVYGGKILEASLGEFYPKTTNTLESRISPKDKKSVVVYRAKDEEAPQIKLADKILEACKTQAEWMKNYTYGWQKDPTIEKSKTRGTCVTYVACVLQRIGYLKPGECIWHTEKGKVYGTNDKMATTYTTKALKDLKGTLKAGDVVIVGKKDVISAGESGSHIFIFAGKWDSNDNPYIWDNHSATNIKNGKNGMHTYKGSTPLIAYVRLEG